MLSRSLLLLLCFVLFIDFALCVPSWWRPSSRRSTRQTAAPSVASDETGLESVPVIEYDGPQIHDDDVDFQRSAPSRARIRVHRRPDGSYMPMDAIGNSPIVDRQLKPIAHVEPLPGPPRIRTRVTEASFDMDTRSYYEEKQPPTPNASDLATGRKTRWDSWILQTIKSVPPQEFSRETILHDLDELAEEIRQLDPQGEDRRLYYAVFMKYIRTLLRPVPPPHDQQK